MSDRPVPMEAVLIETAPARPTAPVVFDSPHSGFGWPDDFHPTAPIEAIRTTADAHVDRLLADAPAFGIRLLAAGFPRAYIDVNRDVRDLDASLLSGPWDEPLTPSDYSRRGMGLVRRLALPGVPMYDAPLSPEAVRARIRHCYTPYRERLGVLLDAAQSEHGIVWHVNWHSMKSRGNAMNVDVGALRPDIVVSDRRGQTASDGLVSRIVGWFAMQGYVVQANDPYQGGDLVRAVGHPAQGRSSVQIEINRALYMDEATRAPHAGFDALRDDLRTFAETFARWARAAAGAR